LRVDASVCCTAWRAKGGVLDDAGGFARRHLEHSGERGGFVLAPVLRLALAIEVVLGLWLGLTITRAFEVPAGWGLLGVPVVVVGVPLAATMLSFLVAMPFRHAHDSGSRLGLWRGLRWFACELAALSMLYVLLQPFERRFVRGPSQGGGQGTARPVILLHGIYCNAASWWWMRRRLDCRGIGPVYALDVEPPLGSIDGFARQLARFIGHVRTATGAERVVLVGHSMGGLVARACMALPGLAPQVEKLLTIGSPHHGSRHARLGIGANSRQLETGSDWLCRLNADPASLAVPIVSIYSRHDNFVAPQESAVLPGARLIALEGVGHLALLFDRVVGRSLCDAIEEPEPGVAPLAAHTSRQVGTEPAAAGHP